MLVGPELGVAGWACFVVGGWVLGYFLDQHSIPAWAGRAWVGRTLVCIAVAMGIAAAVGVG